MSGEHARSDSDPIALRTIYAILAKFSYNRYSVKSCSVPVKWSDIFKYPAEFGNMCGCSHAQGTWETSLGLTK